MNPFRQGIKALLSTVLPPRLWLVHGPRNGNGIALTFDDGPHPEHTPRLLDELQKNGVPATFFVVGQKAEKHPDLVRRIVADGHALGDHSYTHSEPNQTSAAVLLAEMRQSRQLLEDLTGSPVHLFRPPKGELTPRKMWGIWRQEQTIALWNVDPRDYRLQRPDPLIRWCREYQPAAGDIILLHDNHAHCIAAVQELVPRLAADSKLTFQTLTDWEPQPSAGLLDPKHAKR